MQLWNEVESSFSSYPEDIRKTLCEEYGIVYFYRKGELEKAVEDKIDANGSEAAEPPVSSQI